jgi:5-methylcytosine-specific restriction endonuclease McrA
MTEYRGKDPRDSRKWRALRKTILARDSFTCGYCGQMADTVDHVLPVRKYPDQAMNPENLISACRACNSAKGSRSEASFLARAFADRKSTRLNSSHCTVSKISRMPSSA